MNFSSLQVRSRVFLIQIGTDVKIVEGLLAIIEGSKIRAFLRMRKAAEKEILGHIFLRFRNSLHNILLGLLILPQVQVHKPSIVENIRIAIVDIVSFVQLFEPVENLLQSF